MVKKVIAVLAMLASVAVIAGCAQTGVERAVSLPSDFPVPDLGIEVWEADEEEAGEESQGSAAGENATKPSGASSSSSESSDTATGSAGVAPPQQEPAHEHSWVVHEAVYQESPVYAERVVCSCGQMYGNTGSWDTHNQSLGFGESHSYSVRRVQVDTDTVLVSEGYSSCACGAVK